MNKICEILFSALRSSLFGGVVEADVYRNLTAEEWQQLFRMAAQQGVVAIVYDVVSQLPKDCQPPRNIHIQWALSTEAIENRYKQQFEGAKYLGDLWANEGIKTIVLKGFSLSRYYPIPNHRECGDFDCFLQDGRYEEGNIIAERNGAKVNRGWYKHSQIYFRGMITENHQFLVTTRKGRSAKELNAILVDKLQDGLRPIEGTKLLLSPPSFAALFITYHSFSHFISEGITLRHLLDWACFMRAEQNSFDWEEFYGWCKKFKYDRFVDISNEIITRYFGVELYNNNIVCHSPYTVRVLNNILFEDSKVFSSGKGKWQQRMMLIKNMYAYRWKHRDVAQGNSTLYLMNMIFGYIFKRENTNH